VNPVTDAQLDASDAGPILVVSAHAADFVWRAGGVIAASARAGRQVTVVCLSFGERGESQGAWRRPGMTLERVKEIRRAEAAAAAGVLGAEITFLDAGDYPLPQSPELLDALVEVVRATRPHAILTHSSVDPYNTDHPFAAELTLTARMVAQADGLPSAHAPIGAPPLFRFEPHQPEMCDFRPDVLLDVSEVFEVKLAAMRCMKAQEHLVRYYTDLGLRRGVQAVRNGGRKEIIHAEAFQRVFPLVTGTLV
jgi:4-oxalomesaconate hydratase